MAIDVAFVARYALAIVTATTTLLVAKTSGAKGVDTGGLGVEITTRDVVVPFEELAAKFQSSKGAMRPLLSEKYMQQRP